MESFAAAEAEIEKLRGLELEVLAQKPDEWRWPGLTALELGRKYLKNDAAKQRRTAADESKSDGKRLSDSEKKELTEKAERKASAQTAVEERWPGLKAWPGLETLAVAGTLSLTNDEALALAGTLSLTNNSAKPRAPLEEAFRIVLEPNPKNNEPKVYVDPEVYVARHDYRLKQLSEAKKEDLGASMKSAKEDLDAALKLVPAKSLLQSRLLLQAAAGAQREGAIAVQQGSREKAAESYANACGYYERAIEAAPSDPRAYLGYGELCERQGDLNRAIQIWRRGLKGVKADNECLGLNLDLSEALLQQHRPMEAEAVLKTVIANVDGYLAKLDPRVSPKVRLSLQHRIDQQNAQLFFLEGQYEKAIPLLADLAVSKARRQRQRHTAEDLRSLDAVGPFARSAEALGSGLGSLRAGRLQEPQELAPRLAAAEVDKAAGRRDAAIASYQQALAIVNA